MGLVSELRRRSVFRMAVLYLGAAWLILQVVDLLIDRGPLPDSLGSLTLTALVVGFPIALVLSWFYEITPEGIARDEDFSSDASAPISVRRMDFVIIAVLAAAVLLFAYDKWWIGPPAERTVAVLPFVAMSSGEDDGYFADGLTEEILNSLAQLPELQVTARTSSFFFKGKDVALAEIADLLGVAHVVEGSVRRDGERLRITSQLVRAADGFHLWSQTYDRKSEEIFAVQQDIAEKVAGALNVILDDAARERMLAMRINDVEAFIAYQKGLDFYVRSHEDGVDVEGLAIANEYFDKAIEAQPNLAAARVLRSDHGNHLLSALIGREEPDIDKVKEQVEAVRNELDLAWRASPSGNQRDILELERKLYSDDWTGLTALIKRAMQPGDCPSINNSEDLWNLGFAEELAEKLEESLACDPLNAYNIYRLAKAYSVAGRPEEALELLRRAEATGVKSPARFKMARNYALIVAGRSDGFEFPDDWRGQILRPLIEGNEAEARQMAKEVWNVPNIWVPFTAAQIAGDRARANELAARIDKYPGSAIFLISANGVCRILATLGCQNGVPFDLEATPNLRAQIEESDLQWPPVAFLDTPNRASQ